MSRNRTRPRRGDPRKATIERYRAITIGHMVTNTRALLPCGCAMYVGVLPEDDSRATTGAQPCCEEHKPVCERANQLLLEELAKPRHELVVNIARQALSQAAHELL